MVSLFKKISITFFIGIFSLLSQITSAAVPAITIGQPQAPVQIQMYFSLTCTHCKEFMENSFPTIKERFIDRGLVSFSFHDFPTDPIALDAAKIARCLGPNSYLKIVQALLKDQEKWATEKGFEEKILPLAEQQGISADSCKKCLKNDQLEKDILRDCLSVRQAHKIDYAPAFFINGKLFEDEVTVHVIEKIVAEKSAIASNNQQKPAAN